MKCCPLHYSLRGLEAKQGRSTESGQCGCGPMRLYKLHGIQRVEACTGWRSRAHVSADIWGMGGFPSRPPPDLVVTVLGLTVQRRYLVAHFLHGSGSLFVWWWRTHADANIGGKAHSANHWGLTTHHPPPLSSPLTAFFLLLLLLLYYPQLLCLSCPERCSSTQG